MSNERNLKSMRKGEMNYTEFKQKVENEFMNYVPSEFANYKFTPYLIRKVNKSYDGFFLKGDGNVAPIINITSMYSMYLECGSWLETMSFFVNLIIDGFKKSLNVKLDKEKIVFQLINTEQNKDLLANIPYIKFFDLSIIFRIIISIDDGIQGILINNNILDILNMTKDELYKCAYENTRKLLKPNLKPLSSIISQLLNTDSNSLPSTPSNQWVISNHVNCFGASIILYEDILYNLSVELNTNYLVIIPSSIHEVICDIDYENRYDCLKMVRSVNSDENIISTEDKLSDNIYIYNKNERKISLLDC